MARKKDDLADIYTISRFLGITSITVGNLKSIAQETTLTVEQLTVLAGANSSGKSTFMQAALLLKQTLEATSDPGALLLSGPNVRFTSFDSLLSRCNPSARSKSLVIGIGAGFKDGGPLRIEFSRDAKKLVTVSRMSLPGATGLVELRPGLTREDIEPFLSERARRRLKSPRLSKKRNPTLAVRRRRCFLEVVQVEQGAREYAYPLDPDLGPGYTFENTMTQMLHLPGLRGTAERMYPLAAVGEAFPGTFDPYVASVIARWQSEKKTKNLRQLAADLSQLGLTWKVVANPINDAQMELRVGRLAHARPGGAHDMVNIADVGIGVSQTLPVLVALLVAEIGQLVYLEQPEIHLHPRAQLALAGPIIAAARRGVRVVVETHSSTLLLGLQTAIARGALSPELTCLHWFERDPRSGATSVRSGALDRTGAYGDWPEDFGTVELTAEDAYLTAVERAKKPK